MSAATHGQGWGFTPEIDRTLPEAALREQIDQQLEAESVASFLIRDSMDRGEDFVPDFLWLYHGDLLDAGQGRPEVERNGINYDQVLISAATQGGRFLVHLRAASGIPYDDNRHYFAALLDLAAPQMNEWPVADIHTSHRPISYGQQDYMHTELLLSNGPIRSVEAGTESPTSQYEATRARKLGSLVSEQSLAKLPRIVRGHQRSQLIYEGQTDTIARSIGSAVKGASRILCLRDMLDELDMHARPAEIAELEVA